VVGGAVGAGVGGIVGAGAGGVETAVVTVVTTADDDFTASSVIGGDV
jgi:hypothetical protein